MRKTIFQNDNFYHIFNRGVDKRVVFSDEKDYFNFLIRLNNFNNDSKFEKRIYAQKEPSSLAAKELGSLPCLVEIMAYCLNPNHYHLLLRQKTDKGIEKFLHKIGTGYTNYFNKRYKRTGALFQGKFKSVAIKTDPQLLYIASYINGNAEIHGVTKAEGWQYGSYLDYIGKRQGTLSNKKVILSQFKIVNDYIEYTDEVIKNSKSIKDEVRQYLLE